MRPSWIVGVILLSGCFRPTPCVRDSQCGGPGGVCDLSWGFCVTAPLERDDGGPQGGHDGGADGGADGGVDGGTDAGDDGGSDAGPDAGVDAGGALDGGSDGGADAGVAPTILAFTPLDLATNVQLGARPSATFDQPMDPVTLTPSTFTLVQGSTPVPGLVTLDGPATSATFTPTARLAHSRLYSATLTTGAQGAGGLALAASHVWTFVTTPLDLGTAQAYSVLGASVTNTGPTTLSGSLGVSPGVAMGGFPPGTVAGEVHAGDAAAAQAEADLLIAYTDAAARPATITLAGDLAGQTLLPGVYRAPAAITLSTTLTLDGQGDPNALFVFQIDAAFDTAAASRLTLANGARAAHVIWQASGAVTLGAASSFEGTVLGAMAITVGAGTSLTGRVLSLHGAVTLSSNPVASPRP